MSASDEKIDITRVNYAKALAKAWRDEAYKARLLGDPRAALVEVGVDVPAGITVKLIEDTADAIHFVLPLAPPGNLSQEELEKVSAGSPTVIRDDRLP